MGFHYSSSCNCTNVTTSNSTICLYTFPRVDKQLHTSLHSLIFWFLPKNSPQIPLSKSTEKSKSRMGMETCKFVVAVVVVIALLYQSFAVQHMVGDESHWTIPPNNDFYSSWSSSQLFQPGDTLCILSPSLSNFREIFIFHHLYLS